MMMPSRSFPAVKAARMRSTDASLDALLGSAGDGRADMAFLNAMGYQASAVGNHELDGPIPLCHDLNRYVAGSSWKKGGREPPLFNHFLTCF